VTAAALADQLARLELFARLDRADVARIAERYDTIRFEEGEWVVREGTRAGGLYVVIDGEAAAVVEDQERGRIRTGSFFGDISTLLDEPATAAVVVRVPLHCLVVPEGDVDRFLVENPHVALQMLRTMARRLQAATRWRA
jgi:CRP/FNR family transcriptional regulator, anaerobic regulatory protein